MSERPYPTRGRGRIGLLVPFTNTNLEPDFAMMRPEGVSLHAARLGGYDEDEVPDAAQMQGLGAADLDGPLHLLSGVRPDVVVYGCTSATLTHGRAFDAALARRIATASGAATVTAAGALVQALRALGVGKVGFASPYVPAINDAAIAFLAAAGVEVVARAEVAEVLSNEGQGAMGPEAVRALGQRADAAETEALVLSCTDMRAVEIIAALEAATGKPVVTSNQAMMFAALCQLGIDTPVAGFGRVLSEVPRGA